MRSLSSNVLALSAMALSSFTTYLTFFDARYTLTTAMANVTWNVRRSGGSNGEKRTVSYRPVIMPSVIVSNRGTRAIVVTDLSLVRSTSMTECEDSGVAMRPNVYRDAENVVPAVVEPNTVQHMRLEFSLNAVSSEVPIGQPFDLQPTENLWCLKWVVFDPNGRRSEPMVPAMTIARMYAVGEDDATPESTLDVDFPRKPNVLLSRGLF